MARDNDADFRARLDRSAEARKQALKKFRAAPGPDDPAFAQRQSARQEIHASRKLRRAQQAADKEARATERAEQAGREAERAAQADRDAAENATRNAAEDAQRKLALETERKKV